MDRIGVIVFAPVLFMVIFGLSGCWGGSSNQQTGNSYTITSLLLDPDSCGSDSTTGLVDCPAVYAATAGGGIFKSLDGGGSWNGINNGLFELNIAKLVMDPKNPAILYAGTENNGLFKTFDGGTTWAVAGTSGSITSITSIAIDPLTCLSPPCTDIYIGSQDSGVWVSQDRGLSWTQMNNGLEVNGTTVTALTIFSYNKIPSDLYAGTEGGHLYRFDNTNKKWEEFFPGLSDKTSATPLVIAINPIVPMDFYVGTSGGEKQTTGGLFRSNDGGLNWNVVTIPTAQGFGVRLLTFCIQIAPRCPPTVPEGSNLISEPDALYAGINGLSKNLFKEGEFWTNLHLQLEQGNNSTSLAIDILRHTTLYAGTLRGYIMKSQDEGTTWTRIDINL